MPTLKEKIMGSLAAGTLGDAMGAVTEVMTVDYIWERYGLVDKLYTPDDDRPFVGGLPAGVITDDSGQMFEMLQAYFDGDGKITAQLVGDALVRWGETGENLARFAGPTTRIAIERIKNGEDPVEVGKTGGPNVGNTNGCAMKVAPAGIFNPGDLDGAIRDACTICIPTHATQTSMAAASAIAAGIAEAMKEDCDLFSIYDACLYGAYQGEAYGKKHGRATPCASIPERIKMAASIGITAVDIKDACFKMNRQIGTSVMCVESIPAAIGLLIAAKGDPLMTVAACSSAGDDTDTVAIMAGAIAGAYKGIQAVPADMVKTLAQVNAIDFEGLTDRIYKIVSR